MKGQELLQLQWRPYRFALPRSLLTSRGALVHRCGWLLRLSGPDGSSAWGEAASPFQAALPPGSVFGFENDLAAVVAALPTALERSALEGLIPQLPAPLACGLGMALAELDGLGSDLRGGWRLPPASAWLLPAGQGALAGLEQLLADPCAIAEPPLTLKWKVATGPDVQERSLLEALLQRLPARSRLRLDANGGWDRITAFQWADRLAGEQRLEWLEQPLAPADRQGLELLAARLPVALDESLPHLSAQQRESWPGWLVRRPLQEGDPRPLLRQLEVGAPRLMLSTAFETGIGRRFVAHLAALQADGPTPTAPGFAPGWRPGGDLFANEPLRVWEAVA